MAGGGHFWPFYPAAGWGIGLGMHALAVTGWHHHASGAGVDPAQREAERQAREQRRAEHRAARRELRTASHQLALEAQRTATKAVRQLGNPPWMDQRGPGRGHRSGPPRSPWAPPTPGQGHGGRAGEPSTVDRVAVLFVDVVGSTKLTDAMGDEAWRGVRARFRELVGRCLSEHSGTEVNLAGDGILARFGDEVSSVRCAIGIQRALAAQREATGFAPAVRIGVHAGPAVADGDDLIGSSVNLAARVSDEAEPGEVLVTEAVAERLDGRFHIEDRGLRTIKGASQPRHLLAVAWR